MTSTATHTFNPDVLCGTSEWHEIRFDAEDCTDLKQSDWQWIVLICDPCDPAFPQVSAHSNGTTYVEPSPDDTNTAVQFVVTNRSGEPRTVDLGLSMAEPWTVRQLHRPVPARRRHADRRCRSRRAAPGDRSRQRPRPSRHPGHGGARSLPR